LLVVVVVLRGVLLYVVELVVLVVYVMQTVSQYYLQQTIRLP
jgi:hypothetical protein